MDEGYRIDLTNPPAKAPAPRKKARLRALFDKAKDAVKSLFGADASPMPLSASDTAAFENFMNRAEPHGRRSRGIKRSDHPPGSRRKQLKRDKKLRGRRQKRAFRRP